MDIFESLENLNVSEECFNNIMRLVEAYIDKNNSLSPTSHIKRVYGEPVYDYPMKDKNGVGYGVADVPANKSAELIKKTKKTNEKTKHFHKEGGGDQGDSVDTNDCLYSSDKKDKESLKLYRSAKKGLKKRGLNNDQAMEVIRKNIDKFQ